MAYNSDTKIKRIFLEITSDANLKNLKPRWFDESRDDQKLWNEGGLTFQHDGFIYGSNDFGWYNDDPCIVNGYKSNTTPVIVAEGTLGINKGNIGSAQFARFSHALGASYNKICAVTFQNFQGIYNNKPAYSQYDYVLATIDASKILKTPNLFIDSDEPRILVDLLKAYDEKDKSKIYKITNEINTLAIKFSKNRRKQKSFLIRNSFNKFQKISWVDFYYKKYPVNTIGFYKTMWFNIFSFTTPDRNDHTVLGEMLANSFLFYPFKSNLILPNIKRGDFEVLKNTEKKELRLLFNHPKIVLITFDDIDFTHNKNLSNGINSIYKKIMKGKVGLKKEELKREFEKSLLEGLIKLKI